MSEIDKAREAATVQCDHEWLRSYLIPRCHKCGHTEATILYLNQGIRQGFDAGYATATAKIERLEKALKQARLDFAFLSVRNLGKSIADKAVEAIDKALEPKDGEL